MTSFDILQTLIVNWGMRAFGVKEMTSVTKRTMRLVEEVLELAQAEGVEREKIATIADMVYDRERGR